MSLGEALGWKYDHAPGIGTRQNPKTGEIELTGWPESLGPAPDKAQQAAIMAEYAADLAQQRIEPTEDQVLLEALKEKVAPTTGELDAAKDRLRQQRGAKPASPGRA